MPVDPLSLGLSVGGNVLGAVTGASAARQRNRILAQGSREQNRAGMESAGVTGDFLAQLRNSTPNPAPERGAFVSTLQGAPGVTGPATASSRFRADAAGATAGAQGYGRQMADLFSRIRAPGLQRQQESEMALDAGNRLRPIQMRAQDQEFLTNLRAGMKQPDPWLGMLSQGLSSLGSYFMAQPRTSGGSAALVNGTGGKRVGGNPYIALPMVQG